MPGDAKRGKKTQGGMAQAGLYMGVGLQFAATIAIVTFGGWWLDEKWSTSPLLLIAGMLSGATAAFYHLYKTLTRTDEEGESNPSEPAGPADRGV